MYGIDLSVQMKNLMPALGLGFILGFVCDTVRFLRLSFSKGKTALFIADFLFVIFCTVSSYLMILGVNNGNIRIYLIVAEITGAAIYFCTAGVVVSSVFRRLSGIVRRIFHAVFLPFSFLSRKIVYVVKKIQKLACKIFCEIKKNQKKTLKDEDEMLYNNNN